MKRLAVVLVVLVALAAVQATPGIDEATSVRDSECYTCHFEGGPGLGPNMIEMFRVRPAEPLELAPGEEGELVMEVVNWWVAELSGFQARIDLTGAPAFAFTAPPPPVLDNRLRGDLAFVLEEVAEPERSASLDFDVPASGTDLQVRLVPERTSGSQAPDLILRVWPPGRSLDEPPETIDRKAHGGTEVFELAASPVPTGRWTVEVAQRGALEDIGFDESRLVDQPFGVDWSLWYNYTAEDPVRFGASDEVLDGQEKDGQKSTRIAWPIALRTPVTTQQAIHVEVTAKAEYDHPPQFQAKDTWLFVHDTTLIVRPPPPVNGTNGNATDPGGTPGRIVLEDPLAQEAGPDLSVPETIPMARWGEVVGYMAGFLLIVSLVSGGAFGEWSRRLQRWVLFRRGQRRIHFHTVVSYGLLTAAIAHVVLFLVETRFPWSVGILLGGASLLGMVLAGFTGALQKPMVRAMGFGTWRWVHYLSFAIAFAGAAAHIALDGIHFVTFQDQVGWQDPAVGWLESILPTDPAVEVPAQDA